MSITAKIKDAEANYQRWARITANGAWTEHNKTIIQALALMHYHEGRLEAFTEAKQLMRVGV